MKVIRFFRSSAFFALTSIATLWAFAADEASRPSESQVEEYLKGSALIGFEWVDQPLNRILLLRGQHATCALRFVSYRRANDGRPATSFDTGDASEFAVYEVSELNLTGTTVVQGPVVRKELEYRGMRGIGRLALAMGNTDILCGRDKYTWMFPTGLMLKKEQGNAMVAPTNWTSYESVRMDHPKLRWYQRDARMQRSMLILPQEDLPQ